MPSNHNPRDYDKNVFINCPFDDAYQGLMNAAVFAVFDCGFRPRCALESSDGSEVRFEKIVKIISECKYGIHDISRTDLDPTHNLPRFNMPLELGLFLGAKKFGPKPQKSKICLIIDSDKYRYQKFISDISGQDIADHGNDPEVMIGKVRDWLSTNTVTPLPGSRDIIGRFRAFLDDFPALCSYLRLHHSSLSFKDYSHVTVTWLNGL